MAPIQGGLAVMVLGTPGGLAVPFGMPGLLVIKKARSRVFRAIMFLTFCHCTACCAAQRRLLLRRAALCGALWHAGLACHKKGPEQSFPGHYVFNMLPLYRMLRGTTKAFASSGGLTRPFGTLGGLALGGANRVFLLLQQQTCLARQRRGLLA